MKPQAINPKSTNPESLCNGYKFTGRVLDSNNVILALHGGNEMFEVQNQMRSEAVSLQAEFEIGYIQTVDNQTHQILLSQHGLNPYAKVSIS